MKVKQDAYDVGVIVARFQVPDLHEAHRSLIEHAMNDHERVIVFLGLSGSGQPTKENPLDYQARLLMLRATFPDLEVHYIADTGNDEAWSAKLDNEVGRLLPAGQTAVLYGGRDSFVGHYHGKLPTCELEPEVWVSGTDIRKAVSKRVKASSDFRAGVIWATQSRFDAVISTVDVAVLDHDRTKLLLGMKPAEPLWRFLGGFAEPRSASDEEDAQREVREEANIEVSPPIFIGRYAIDDWRYRGESDKIRTSFFLADYLSGTPLPADDLKGGALKWFNLDEVTLEDIMPLHRPLLQHLRSALTVQAGQTQDR